MAATTRDSASDGAALVHWLRLLFDRAPALCFDSEAPFIAAGAIHLPPGSGGAAGRAAAGHAAAHMVHSPPLFDGRGLGPIARTLVGLLEDARVEALATCELPGLARLWRPLHRATPALGTSFEALLQRLSRALAEPAYDDPDAWVRKGRALFYLDAELGMTALRTPAEVRHAALLLGHDIGQMRLPFNAKTYRPQPDYRDDHRWMWPADRTETLAPMPQAAGSAGDRRDHDDDRPATAPGTRIKRYPEWDRLIERSRPDWCRVVEHPAPLVARPAEAAKLAADAVPAGRRGCGGTALHEALRALTLDVGGSRRSEEGEAFVPDALVEWRVAQRLGGAGDPRLYSGAHRRVRRTSVLLLVDRSASSAEVPPAGKASLLQIAAGAAIETAQALQTIAIECAVAAFSSYGRHEVRVSELKGFGEPADAAVAARLETLRAGGSTRLGAALRHATSRLAARPTQARWLIVFSDGEPHDIDVHDPRYLVEDARRAVQAAANQSVRTVCVALGATDAVEHPPRRTLARIFGHRAILPLRHPCELAAAFRRVQP